MSVATAARAQGFASRLSVASPRRKVGALIANVILVLVGVMFLVPLVWIVLASVDADAGVAVALPDTWTFDNYASVMTVDLAWRPLGNSLLLSFGAATLTVAAALLAAYPLSRYQMRFRRGFMYAILFGTGLPITAIMVPVYALFVTMGLLDNIWGTIAFLAATSLPMAIWMMKNFMDSIPVSLEEAAWVDGASGMTSLARIVIPLMRTGIGVVFVFVFTMTWGNFFVPFVLLFDSDKFPAAVSIFNFFGQYGTVAYGQLAAYSVIYSVPVITLYVLVQRLTGSSFALAGAVKG